MFDYKLTYWIVVHNMDFSNERLDQIDGIYDGCLLKKYYVTTIDALEDTLKNGHWLLKVRIPPKTKVKPYYYETSRWYVKRIDLIESEFIDEYTYKALIKKTKKSNINIISDAIKRCELSNNLHMKGTFRSLLLESLYYPNIKIYEHTDKVVVSELFNTNITSMFVGSKELHIELKK